MSFKEIIDKNCTYEVILCRPNKEHVCYIEYSDLSYNPLFDEFNGLDITISYWLSTITGERYINPCWDLIVGRWLIYLEKKSGNDILHKEYFVIENPNFSGSEIDTKSFKCFSYEKLDFNNKLLDGFRGNVAKRIYDPSNSIDKRDNLPLGVMNYICGYKLYDTWTIGHVDEALLGLERLVSFSGSTSTSALTLLGERFGCIFVFDNINKIINIYQRKVGMLGENRGLIIADDSIMSIDYLENDSGLKTRLYINGKNNATFALWNPTGQRYKDDFTYYMKDRFMSKSLQNALKNYNDLIDSKTLSFNQYTERLVAGDQSVKPYIQQIRDSLLWEKNFTRDQIEELVPYIHEDIKTVSEISDERQLYEYASKYLKTISFVPIQISVSSVDIFALKQFQFDWDKFKIGDFANIFYKPFNLVYKEMRLVSYTHNPVSNSLQLEFSNVDELITRQQEDYYFTTTISDIGTTVLYNQDEYLSFSRAQEDITNQFEEINEQISSITSGGITLNKIFNNNKNRLIINSGGIGFEIRKIADGIETKLFYLDENGNLRAIITP